MYQKLFKRFLDIIIGFLGVLCLVLPLSIILLFPYSFGKNKGPLFFRQERLGKNGTKFKIIKFRSMVVNSEEVLKSNSKLYEEYVKNDYKLPAEIDPRITSLGKFLRKSSLDEFPQFWNILVGNMSFIGPRPIVPMELNEYKDQDKSLFLSVKPGAIGWWQVSGRSNVKYPERCDVELYYAKNASFKLDCLILFKSFGKVLSGEGAH